MWGFSLYEIMAHVIGEGQLRIVQRSLFLGNAIWEVCNAGQENWELTLSSTTVGHCERLKKQITKYAYATLRLALFPRIYLNLTPISHVS